MPRPEAKEPVICLRRDTCCFTVGRKTPLLIRFSTVAGELGSADTHLRDNNMQWDFWTLSPESAHQVTILMSDRGTPASWRSMNGYGSHTFLWYNAGGEKFWVKYHFKTDQGVENFTNDKAVAMASTDPDFHIRDLHTAIKRGDFPSWTVQVQVMPFEEAADYRFNPFDLTKVWPHDDYESVTIGRFTLDRNPENYFAEIEQAAFEPANMVPGVPPSPDKMLQGRLFSYPDTHRYRIGTNYLQLPVNRPHVAVHSYNRDGAMRQVNPGDPVYAPNSAGGPAAGPGLWQGESYGGAGEIIRTTYTPHAEDDDFGQPRTLWEKVLSETDREHLIANIVAHAGAPEVTAETRKRVVEYWTSVHADLGAGVAEGLDVG